MNPVDLMQSEIVGRLNADDYFSDITVLAETEGDIENTIARALKAVTTKSGAIGMAVVVGAFSTDADSPDLPGPHFTNSSCDVTVFEHVTFNRGANGSGKAGVLVAVRAAQVLHHYHAGGIGQTLLVTGKDCIESLGEQPAGSGVVVHKTRVGIPMDTEVLDKVVTPTISPSGGAVPQAVTLTCATADAEMYYTLDDSYPWSGNNNATLYSAPFNVSAAATLRVVAHKEDCAASDAAFGTFT